MIEHDLVYRDVILRLICPYEFFIEIKNLLQGHVEFKECNRLPSYRLHISDEVVQRRGQYFKLVDKWFDYATADCYIDNENRICYLNNIWADSLLNKNLLIQYFTLNVFSRLIEMKGFIALHSSCVENNGKGIIFVAGRNCGKTNCLLNMMQDGYNFVTNDKSAIGIVDKQLICYGIAQSVSIRMSKVFRDRVENRKYIEIAKQQGIMLQDENILEGNNILMNDLELSILNNVKVKPDTLINLLFKPKYIPNIEHPEFIRMTFDQSKSNILEQILPVIHDTTSFLSNIHLNDEVIVDFNKLVNKLATLPSYVVLQNENTTEEFIEKVKKI